MDLLQACALVASSVAAYIDVRSRRIPNWLTLATLVLGVAMNVALHGLGGAATALVGAAIGFGMLVPFYAMRVMGAGDVKLLAAVGALVGPQALVSVAIYGALVGGAMSLLILLARGHVVAGFSTLMLTRRLPPMSGLTAPYGVAIAAGVYLSLILPGVVA